MAVLRKDDGTVIATQVEFADNLLRQTLGLMFRKGIPEDYAMIFDMHSHQYINIHMLFVFFPIDLVYLDSDKRVIDVRYLKSWIGHASSRRPVRYAIEMPAGSVGKASLKAGDLLEW